MIDYRIPLVKFIKRILGDDFPVFDGAMSFHQPESNYLSYYILSEQTKSFKNQGAIAYSTFLGKFQQEHTPFKRVSLSIDIRGDNSFYTSRRLLDSFYEQDNIDTLATLGIGFLGTEALTSLPVLKDSYNEEGYLFVLHISYDASYITDIEVIQGVKLVTGKRNCGSSETIIPTDCSKGIFGTDNKWNDARVWLDDCKMFQD